MPGFPTLVLLHEGLGSVSSWRDFPDRLARATGLPALVYSRAGYGRSSPKPPPWGPRYMHEEAELLPGVLAAASIDDCVLVGHSDGASIALLAAAGPLRAEARALLLEAPHVFAEEEGLRSIARVGEAYRASDELRRKLARHHDDPDAAFQGWNGAWLDPAFRAWNLVEHLPRVRAPALVLQGDADEYGTIAHARTIERRSCGPVETLVLAGCGHAPHRERGQETEDAMRDFLARRGLLPAA